MSATYELRIKPIEPPHMATTRIEGIELISTTRITYTPLPTTILGLLANIYCEGRSCQAQPQDCITDLLNMVGEMGIEEVWGPLVVIDGKEHFQVGNALLPLQSAERYAELVKGGCEEECLSKVTNEWYEFRETSRVGIALDRQSRTVAQGFMYGQRYAWPHKKVNNQDRGPVEVGNWHYRYLITTGQNGKWLSKIDETTWRVGGEGRQAIIEIETTNKEPPQPSNEGILLTPLLFKANHPSVGTEQLGLEVIYGVLTNDGPRIKVTTASLGYNEVLKCRRPTYPALPPGTLIKTKQETRHAGLHKELGYGTTLPTT